MATVEIGEVVEIADLRPGMTVRVSPFFGSAQVRKVRSVETLPSGLTYLTGPRLHAKHLTPIRRASPIKIIDPQDDLLILIAIESA